jgi:hypothetical protein
MGGLNSTMTTLVGTGFDNRTASGPGTLQLVSPNVVDFNALGTVPVLSTLTITFVPEPTTALLLGAGLAALACLSRRRTAQLG